MSRKIIAVAIILNVRTYVHGWVSSPLIDQEYERERTERIHGLYNNLARECFLAGRICLFGGERTSGTVLLGGWPVCYEDWDIKDATVTCRSLGFARATNATKSSDFDIEDRFSDFYAMKNVQELAIIYQFKLQNQKRVQNLESNLYSLQWMVFDN